MTPLELAENQACEKIAEDVACEHSPAVPGSHEAAGIHAAEEIARRIRARQVHRLESASPTFKVADALPFGTRHIEDLLGHRWVVAQELPDA